MWASVRGALVCVRGRWIFILMIVILLLVFQFLVSAAWMKANFNTRFFGSFFKREVELDQESDLWNPSGNFDQNETEIYVSMNSQGAKKAARVSHSSRRSRQPPKRHIYLTRIVPRTRKEGLATTPVTTAVQGVHVVVKEPMTTTVRNEIKRARTTMSNMSNSRPLNNLPFCPLIPKGLVGPITPNMTAEAFSVLEEKFKDLEPGGRYKPPKCRSRHKVAIVIPYRNREEHLRIFLNNMHPFLQKQQLEYGIYVVDQKMGTTFNRAMLMNIGFVEAMKQDNYTCCAFHDVDLIPEDDRNLYSCPEQPRHLSVAIDKFAYKLPYVDIFGGASEIKTEHFRKINGFSNKFWGWGGEDDDMSSRVRDSGLHITRYPVNIARYKMIHHRNDKGNPVNPRRFALMRQGRKRFHLDGLNTLKYNLVGLEKRKLYTWVYVDINERNS